MFEWVKGLFKKKQPEFDLSMLVTCRTLYSERTKKGRFAKGHNLWRSMERDRAGKFMRSK